VGGGRMEGSRRESRKGWEELPTPRAGGAGVYGDAETGFACRCATDVQSGGRALSRCFGREGRGGARERSVLVFLPSSRKLVGETAVLEFF
jgi:hypothetical protein